jgi:hypothetical protein
VTKENVAMRQGLKKVEEAEATKGAMGRVEWYFRGCDDKGPGSVTAVERRTQAISRVAAIARRADLGLVS